VESDCHAAVRSSLAEVGNGIPEQFFVTTQHVDVDERDGLDCAGMVGEEPELGRVIPRKESVRIFGVGNLTLETSGETSRLVLDDVDSPQATADEIMNRSQFHGTQTA